MIRTKKIVFPHALWKLLFQLFLLLQNYINSSFQWHLKFEKKACDGKTLRNSNIKWKTFLQLEVYFLLSVVLVSLGMFYCKNEELGFVIMKGQIRGLTDYPSNMQVK